MGSGAVCSFGVMFLNAWNRPESKTRQQQILSILAVCFVFIYFSSFTISFSLKLFSDSCSFHLIKMREMLGGRVLILKSPIF